MKDQVQQKTGEAIDQAKDKAGEVVGQVREQAKSQVAGQKDRAAESLGSVAQALHQTGQQLRDQDNSTVAQYIDTAANQVDRVSGFLRERDLQDIVTEVERFARRQPAVFVGGAALLGMIGARFLRSSQDRAAQMQRADYYRSGAAYADRGYDTGYSGGYGRGNSGSAGYGGSGTTSTTRYGSAGAGYTSGGYSSAGYSGTGTSSAAGSAADTYETTSLPIVNSDTGSGGLGSNTEG
jgi:hypothetical protein